jgi:hypothetical protein
MTLTVRRPPNDMSRVPMMVPLMGGIGLPRILSMGVGLRWMQKSHPIHI